MFPVGLQALLGVGCMCLLYACGSSEKTMGRAALVKYINQPSNGLMQEQEVNGVNVRLSFQPTGMLVAQELPEGRTVDTAKVHALEKKYSRNYYFLLKYSKDGKEVIRQLGNFSRYSDMVQVFSFEMHRFINLTTSQHDTIPLADYLFEQTYGMGSGNTMLLSFEKEKLLHAGSIDINVGECGLGIGSLRFEFDPKKLERAPRLDYALRE